MQHAFPVMDVLLAKRDVKSDARFVACAKGPAQVRFTWAPP